jgi:UDP-N-acetylglucosamine:LPS N-acetylglucosamine transferase
MKRVLIPYFSAGYGHHSFGCSIKHFLMQGDIDTEVRMFDPGADLAKQKLNDIYVDSWKSFLKMPKKVSQILFDIDNAVPEISSFINKQYLRPAVPAAANFLTGYNPDLIMSTHWGCTHLFNLARQETRRNIPLFYVYTELGGAKKLMNCGADLYFSLSDEASRSLMSIGIEKERIRTINLVVQPDLLASLIDKEKARQQLHIDRKRLTVLYSNGGEGIGPAREFITQFSENVDHGQLLILTGKNEKMFQAIRSNYNNNKIIPFGFMDSISPLFSAADIVAGKCGTSFTMEAIKLGRPMVVTNLGAPNEAENLNYLLEHRFGWFTPKPTQFARLINEIIAGNAEYNTVTDALQHVPDGNGAEEIAAECISVLKKGEPIAGTQ